MAAPVFNVAWAGPNAKGEFWVRFTHQPNAIEYGLSGPFTKQTHAEECCTALGEGRDTGRKPEDYPS